MAVPKLLSYIGYEKNVHIKYDWLCYKLQLKRLLQDIRYRSAFVGDAAPDAELLNFRTNQKVYLLDYQNISKPLIVIFGSCT